MRYVAFQGERWDQIAYKVFGDPWKLPELLDANKIEPRLLMEGGETIEVPKLNPESTTQKPAEVPPWLS